MQDSVLTNFAVNVFKVRSKVKPFCPKKASYLVAVPGSEGMQDSALSNGFIKYPPAIGPESVSPERRDVEVVDKLSIICHIGLIIDVLSFHKHSVYLGVS